MKTFANAHYCCPVSKRSRTLSKSSNESNHSNEPSERFDSMYRIPPIVGPESNNQKSFGSERGRGGGGGVDDINSTIASCFTSSCPHSHYDSLRELVVEQSCMPTKPVLQAN